VKVLVEGGIWRAAGGLVVVDVDEEGLLLQEPSFVAFHCGFGVVWERERERERRK
jgi:hypothetical protein